MSIKLKYSVFNEMLKSFSTRLALICVVAITLVSCRGTIKKKPPIHPNLNMDQVNRFEAMEKNTFFKDNRAMRQPVNGTVSRGNLKLDSAYYEGINEDGSYIETNPHELTRSFLNRGQDQFQIYCTPCHGTAGNGKGIIMVGQYGYVPAPNYHSDRLRNAPDGQIYSAIANGVRSMPSYATQIEVEDRWAIVAYIRALQKSQYVTEEELEKYDVDKASLLEDFKEEQKKAEAKKEAQKKQGGGNVSAERGKKLYTANACQTCHSRDGTDGVGPTHKGIFGRKEEMASGETITIDEEYLYESITQPNTKVVKGYQPAMPSFDYLSESKIQSLIEYLKTL